MSIYKSTFQDHPHLVSIPLTMPVPLAKGHHTPTQDQIRELAYQLWQRAGSPQGSDNHFWLRAEKQLQQQH